MPIGSSGFKEALPLLRGAFADAGRDPDSAEAVPFGVLPSPGKLEYLESLGVREAVLALPKGGADEVLPALDAYAAQSAATSPRAEPGSTRPSARSLSAGARRCARG